MPTKKKVKLLGGPLDGLEFDSENHPPEFIFPRIPGEPEKGGFKYIRFSGETYVWELFNI